MLIVHKGHTDTIQIYSVTVMTHVKALQAGHSSQGTSEPITPVLGRLLRTSVSEVDTQTLESGVGDFRQISLRRFGCRRFSVRVTVRLWVLSPGVR